MINIYVGKEAAGIYSFAYNLHTLIMVGTSSIDNIYSPWFYQKIDNKEYKEIKKVSNLYLLFVWGGIGLVISFTPEIIVLLGSEKYMSAIDIAIPLCVGSFFAFAYTIPAQTEYYLKRTRILAIGSVFAALLNVVLNNLCICKYGYVSAAYTTVITYIIYFFIHTFISKKILGELLFSFTISLSLGILIIFWGIVTAYYKHSIFLRLSIAFVAIFVGGCFIHFLKQKN